MVCRLVEQYLAERGIQWKRSLDMVEFTVGALHVGVWCPRDEFPFFNNVDTLCRVLKIDVLDVLIVVSYRPYVLIDYVSSLLERARRDVKHGVKLLGASSIELESALEEVLGRAFVEKPQKLSAGTPTGDLCPQCVSRHLEIYRREKFYSRKYRSRVIESIYGCNCGFRARRVEILD